jgi:DNA-directed RNA polymerase
MRKINPLIDAATRRSLNYSPVNTKKASSQRWFFKNLEETISEGFSKRSLAVTKSRRRMCEDIYRIVAIALYLESMQNRGSFPQHNLPSKAIRTLLNQDRVTENNWFPLPQHVVYMKEVGVAPPVLHALHAMGRNAF